jgi:hypothetical protein
MQKNTSVTLGPHFEETLLNSLVRGAGAVTAPARSVRRFRCAANG